MASCVNLIDVETEAFASPALQPPLAMPGSLPHWEQFLDICRSATRRALRLGKFVASIRWGVRHARQNRREFLAASTSRAFFEEPLSEQGRLSRQPPSR